MKGKSIHHSKGLRFVILFSLLFLLSFLTSSNVSSIYFSDDHSIKLQADDFISIESDADFIVYGFPGSGNTSHPYIIEDYTITGDYQNGISIKNTTKHFIIRNCSIFVDYGIYITDANKTATIFNNTISCAYSGLRIFDSNECNISKNLCFDTGIYGIYVESCNASFIYDNVCSNALENNIAIYSSPDSIIFNNTCSEASSYGMFIQYSSNSSIINNTFYKDGLEIWETQSNYQTYTIEDNEVNDKLLGFFVDENDIEITTSLYNQIYFITCTDILLSNQNLSHTDTSLFFFNCTGIEIEYNYFTNNDKAFWFSNCWEVSFTHNFVYLNKEVGSFNVWNLTFNNNTVFLNSDEGVNFEGCFEMVILNNTIAFNEYGLYFRSTGSVHMQNNFIYENSMYGVEIHLSEVYTIINNTIANNYGTGLDLDNTHDCVITYNYFVENLFYGVAIHSSSTFNIVHHNAFIDNNPLEDSQAWDSAVYNTWYDEDTEEGNYWSNWDGVNQYGIDGYIN